MKNSHPNSIQEFVGNQKTISVQDHRAAEKEFSRYGGFRCRAIAAMLRSGRVGVKTDGLPNRTDINRICKEANLNQHYFERVAEFLLAANVIEQKNWKFVEGKNHRAFWEHNAKEVKVVANDAVLNLIQKHTGSVVWRPTTVFNSGLNVFLAAFFSCFPDQAFPQASLGLSMQGFCTLPIEDMRSLVKSLGLPPDRVTGWKHWLDEKGQLAILSALYTADWAYYFEEEKTGYVALSEMGQGMLGLAPVPDIPVLSQDLKATSSLAIFAGAGRDFTSLIPLFRYLTIKRIDQLIEFQITPKQLKTMPAIASEELRTVLAELGSSLPSALNAALETESPLTGKLGIRGCSAIIKPETEKALAAIRQHPQLKGYLEAGAPPGYLLIKPNSSPHNFIDRCRALGFQIESL